MQYVQTVRKFFSNEKHNKGSVPSNIYSSTKQYHKHLRKLKCHISFFLLSFSYPHTSESPPPSFPKHSLSLSLSRRQKRELSVNDHFSSYVLLSLSLFSISISFSRGSFFFVNNSFSFLANSYSFLSLLLIHLK